MSRGSPTFARISSILLIGLVAGVRTAAAELAPPGFRPLPLGTHALVGARVHPQPDTVFSNATVVIRDGLIVAVGPEVTPPADARVWDAAGLTIYAGFIDPYLTLGTKAHVSNGPDDQGGSTSFTAAGHRFFGVAGQGHDPGGAGPGHELAGVTPEVRVAARFAPEPKELEGLREIGFTAANVVPSKGVVRGQSAFVTLGDGSPNEAVVKADVAQHVAFSVTPGDAYPNSLMGVIAVVRQTFFDARRHGADVADHAAHPEARSRPAFNAALAALQPTLAGDTAQPVFFEPGSALMVDRATRVAAELGLVRHVIVASGQEWRRPGLAVDAHAPFIVPVAFPALPKFPEGDDSAWDDVSLDQLRAWDWAAENPGLLRRRGIETALTLHALADRKEFRANLRAAIDRGLGENDALAALTTIPAQICGVGDRVGTIAPGKLANLTITDSKGYFDPEGKIRAVWIDGRPYEFPPDKADAVKASKGPGSAEDKAAKEKADKKKDESRVLAKKRIAREPLAGRGVITHPPVVWIRGATVWTSGPRGVLTNADLLVRGGKIEAVGSFADPGDAYVIDGTGLHVSAGIIDCHSHSMILGSVNETGLPSTAMCRVGDVVNSETDTLHQQLAGGVTAVSLLHGSANPIGGQNQVIKLRDGGSPEELKLADAPPGIKFALGENVKQSGWGDKFVTRFPQTRMGVGTFYVNRFTAGQQYLAEWKAFRDGGSRGVPPRRDLELEAVGEIIEGKRLVHCHSYRQDEILAFLRTMESFHVQVGTLQHILEGYKVADEIAKHGAGASSFSDWWAYKYEVIDAIPYAGSLMRGRGVVVSFNSDSSDLARRLNLEAAKAVKYGGTPEPDALMFVTANPAKQLRIDARVGSLEPGKDADFAIWSGNPLDTRSLCRQTWIDGKLYFDRALEAGRAKALADERVALIAKAKRLVGEGGDAAAGDKAREKFFQAALEHARRSGVSLCQDCLLPKQ